MYRQLVFESAERVFADQGFSESTMQDVASEAGISLKTLYATFSGKDEIYGEIQEVRGNEFFEYVASTFPSEGSILEQFEASVRGYVDYLVTHRNFLRIHVREGRAWSLRPGLEASAGAWRQGIQLFATALQQGMEAGVFYQGDPELMAATGIAIMQVQLIGLIDRSDNPEADVISKEILRQLYRSFCIAGEPKE